MGTVRLRPSNPDLCRRPNRSRQRGLTLIELMIASVLSLIIITALTTLFVDVSKSNLEMAKTNSQIENARFAMQFLENDIVHAGYWGAFVPEFEDISLVGTPTDYPTAVPDPCKDFTTWDDDHRNALLGIPVQVYESNTVGTCTMISNRLANTDVLVVRHAETCVAGDTNCEPFAAGKLYFQLSNCWPEIDAPGPEYALDPNSTPARTRLDCTTAAGNRKFIQNLYYVRDYAVSIGDGIPTLVRSQFGLSGGVLAQQPAQALVEGIERFRVELGLDLESETGVAIDPNTVTAAIEWEDEDEWYTAANRGDGIPEEDTIKHCGSSGCSVLELTNVAVVRMYVLARANEVSPGYIDNKTYNLGSATPLAASALPAGYKRHVFATTVRLNNISGRRETP